MKKFFVLTLAFMLSLLVLAGCASEAAPAEPSVSTGSSADEQQNDEPVPDMGTDQLVAPVGEEEPSEEAPQDSIDVTTLKTATIAGTEHDVAAQVELLSDGTLNLTGFSYDGGAPDAYIALGNITDGKFANELLIGVPFDRAYDNETFSTVLDEAALAADYTAISIWCHAYSEDFGSAEFVVVG